MEKNYDALETAVKDLLCELRIDETCLEIMSKGYSPDYSGVPMPLDSDWVNPKPQVQLSKVVAEKLFNIICPKK